MPANRITLVVLILVLGAENAAHSRNVIARPCEGEPPCEPRRDPAGTEPRPPEIAQDANKPAPSRMFSLAACSTHRVSRYQMPR